MSRMQIRINVEAFSLFESSRRGFGWNARIKLVDGKLFLKPTSRVSPPSDWLYRIHEMFCRINPDTGIGFFDSLNGMPIGRFNLVSKPYGWYQLIPSHKGIIEFSTPQLALPEMLYRIFEEPIPAFA